MRRSEHLAALLSLLLLLTACSRASAPPPESPTPPPPAAETAAKGGARAPVPAPNAPTPAQVPVNSENRALYLVERTKEVQEVMKRLGTRAIFGQAVRTSEAYTVSLGERLPNEVRFDLHFTVNRADGTVSYNDPVSGELKRATPVIPPVHPVAGQADQLLGKGDVTKAIELLTAALKEQPDAADLWNLLSYARLQRREWQAAAEAGDRALKLDRFHPYALYNTGIAQLELKHDPEAAGYLRDAAEVQPNRAEPYIGLARAYMAMGRHALAYDSVLWARNWAPASEEVGKLYTTIRGMERRAAPPEVQKLALARLEDGPYTISLVAGENAFVYLEGPEGAVGLPVGRLLNDWARFTRIELPDGATGYLLAGEPVGAYVSHSNAYRLFIRTKGINLRQVLFLGSDERTALRVNDQFRAGGARIQGDQLVATYGDDASGKTTIRVAWGLGLISREARALHLESTHLQQDPNK